MTYLYVALYSPAFGIPARCSVLSCISFLLGQRYQSDWRHPPDMGSAVGPASPVGQGSGVVPGLRSSAGQGSAVGPVSGTVTVLEQPPLSTAICPPRTCHFFWSCLCYSTLLYFPWLRSLAEEFLYIKLSVTRDIFSFLRWRHSWFANKP